MALVNPTTFTPTTSCVIINEFLQQLSTNPTNNLLIHPAVVAFKNMDNKAGVIYEAMEEDKQSYEACHHLQRIRDSLKNTGTMVWLTGNINRPGERIGRNDWHSFILLYHKQSLIIIDPDYKPTPTNTRRIVNLTWLSLLRKLIPMITTKRPDGWARKIERILIGGTGNGEHSVGMCNRMCGEWVRDWIQGGCSWNDFDE